MFLKPVSHPDMEVSEMTVIHVEYLALLMILPICGSRQTGKGDILQGDLPPKLFRESGLLLSWKSNLHQAQLACLGNQEIASRRRLRTNGLIFLHLEIEADVVHRVREGHDSTPYTLYPLPFLSSSFLSEN